MKNKIDIDLILAIFILVSIIIFKILPLLDLFSINNIIVSFFEIAFYITLPIMLIRNIRSKSK